MSEGRPSATVLLVEDDAPTRRRLARAIASHDRLSLVATCASIAEADRSLSLRAPDVLLTDIGLPDGSGIDLIRLVRKRFPDTQAIAITVLGDEPTVMSAIEAGAAGYLLKDSPARSIGAAIEELLDGGSPISAPIARLLLRRIAASPVESAETARRAGEGQAASTGDTTSESGERAKAERSLLTQREHEILNLVAKGFSFPEVARLLGVSPHTVTTHVRHIYEKLQVSSRGEAVFEAVQQGLIRMTE